MILQMFSVHDKQADAYMQPFFMPTVGMAVRAFIDTCGDKNSQFAAHPEDYVLNRIGEWDDSTAVVLTCTPKPVFTALDAVNRAAPDSLVDFPSLTKEAN